MAHTMLPASKPSWAQCLSGSKAARLIYAMGRTEPSGCSCSSAAPNPSMHASQFTWKGREPSATASQSGKTKIGGLASSARISRTIILCVNSNLTPFLRRDVIGRIRLDKSRRKL